MGTLAFRIEFTGVWYLPIDHEKKLLACSNAGMGKRKQSSALKTFEGPSSQVCIFWHSLLKTWEALKLQQLLHWPPHYLKTWEASFGWAAASGEWFGQWPFQKDVWGQSSLVSWLESGFVLKTWVVLCLVSASHCSRFIQRIPMNQASCTSIRQLVRRICMLNHSLVPSLGSTSPGCGTWISIVWPLHISYFQSKDAYSSITWTISLRRRLGIRKNFEPVGLQTSVEAANAIDLLWDPFSNFELFFFGVTVYTSKNLGKWKDVFVQGLFSGKSRVRVLLCIFLKLILFYQVRFDVPVPGLTSGMLWILSVFWASYVQLGKILS